MDTEVMGIGIAALGLLTTVVVLFWKISSNMAKMFLRIDILERKATEQESHRDKLQFEDSTIKEDVRVLDKKFDLMHHSLTNLTRHIEEWVKLGREEVRIIRIASEKRDSEVDNKIDLIKEEIKSIRIKMG